jgi:hypothetical protein
MISTFLFLNDIVPLQIEKRRHGHTPSPHQHPSLTELSIVSTASTALPVSRTPHWSLAECTIVDTNIQAAQTGNPGRTRSRKRSNSSRSTRRLNTARPLENLEIRVCRRCVEHQHRRALASSSGFIDYGRGHFIPQATPPLFSAFGRST